jgi:uncharacterized metal-binding protein YceD (DUF177 family)
MMKNRERIEGAPKSFRIRADNIPAQGLEISEKLNASFVSKLVEEPQSSLGWNCIADMQFACEIEHEADMLMLKGGGDFSVVHPCVRCTEDVEIDVKVDFNARLLPRDQDPDRELELDAETFDDAVAKALEGGDPGESVACYYDDGIIDLSDLLREQLFLEFPLYPSCDCEEAKHPKECDMSVLEAINMPSATIIEHPFARLKEWKPKGV